MLDDPVVVYLAFFIAGVCLYTTGYPSIMIIGWMFVIIAAAGYIGFAHGWWARGRHDARLDK